MRALANDQRINGVSYGWKGARNASPSVQRVNGAVVRSNMANNPRFTSTSGTVEVRRNLFNNPGVIGSTLGLSCWSGTNNSISQNRVDATWSKSGSAARTTWNTVVNPNSGDVSVYNTPTHSGVVASTTYTMVVRRVTDGTVTLGQPDISGRQTVIARSRKTTITPAAGEIVTDWMTFTTPDTFTTDRMLVSISNKTVGCWVEQSEVDIYPGEYQPNRQWSSGSYSPDPDLTPVWVGTENASQSYLRGFVPGNTGVSNNNFTVASQNNGMRLIPNKPEANNSNTGVGGVSSSLSGYGVTFTPGKWYGFQAVCTLLAPQTGSIGSSARIIQLTSNNVNGWTGSRNVSSSQPPNKAGSYQEELVTQLPADSVWASLYLCNGASFGNGDVYWDKLLIVEGDTEEEVRRKLAQGYFDGDTQVNAETINRVTNL